MTVYQFLAGHAPALSLFVTAAGAFVVAYLKHVNHDLQSRITQSFVVGLKEGLSDVAKGKDPQTAIRDAILAAAGDFDVTDHVQNHLDSIQKKA